MPFERDERSSGRAEKLHGLGLNLDPSPYTMTRRRKSTSTWRSLAISLTVICIFIIVLVGPAVPLRRLLHDSVSRDVDALKTFVGYSTSPSDEVHAYRRASIAAVIDHSKREASLQRRSAAAWRASVLDEEIAHKVADLEGPGGVAAAKVYISQEHYDEDRALGTPRSLESSDEAEEATEVTGATETAAEAVVEELLESDPAEPNRYLPAAPKAPWSLENEINAKEKEAGRLASS
jgi:hypothetical protein